MQNSRFIDNLHEQLEAEQVRMNEEKKQEDVELPAPISVSNGEGSLATASCRKRKSGEEKGGINSEENGGINKRPRFPTGNDVVAAPASSAISGSQW